MNNNDRGPNHDLRHFLGLAGQQLRHRMKQCSDQSPTQISRMKLLEDLIKEQVPKNENTRNSAGKTR